MSSSSSSGRAQVQVVPRLAPWEREIVKVLGIDPEVGLAEALTAGIERAGISVDRHGPDPTFVAPSPLRPVVCGRLQAMPQVVVGAGRFLALGFALDSFHTQAVGLFAAGRGRASVVQQSLSCMITGLPERPAPAPGRTVVRFGSDELAARDGAIRQALGTGERATAWLEEFLAARRISVDTTGKPSWRSALGAVAGGHVHGGRRVVVTLEPPNETVLLVQRMAGRRTMVGQLLSPRPNGGAEIVTELSSYAVRVDAADSN